MEQQTNLHYTSQNLELFTSAFCSFKNAIWWRHFRSLVPWGTTPTVVIILSGKTAQSAFKPNPPNLD